MRLKLKRVEKGLTQKELADMVGVGQGFISDYETGRYFPRKKVLDKLAQALECEVRDIL